MPGYNAHYDFGYAFAMTSMTGMNCTLKNKAFFNNFQASRFVNCKAYQIVLNVVAGQQNATAPDLKCGGAKLLSQPEDVPRPTSPRAAGWREELRGLARDTEAELRSFPSFISCA